MRLFFMATMIATLNFNHFSFSQISQTLKVPDEYKGLEFRISVYVKSPQSNMIEVSFRQLNDKGDPIEKGYPEVYRTPGVDYASGWVKLESRGTFNSSCDSLKLWMWYLKGMDAPFNVDDFKAEVKIEEKWVSLDLLNRSFENGKEFFGWTKWEGTEYEIDTENVLMGKQSVTFHIQDLLRYGTYKEHGEKININGINIYYEVYGEGRPLLFLHGNNGSIRSMRHQVDFFRKKYKVIAVDSRGQGLSTKDGQKMTYELMANDMISLLDHLKIDSVDVIGWSDGGNTGLIMAMKQPSKINHLAIMGANLYPGKKAIDSKFWRKFKWLNRYISFLTLFNKTKWKNIRDVSRMPLKYPNIEPKDLSKINCPVLVMAGENDLILEEHTHLIGNHINNSEIVILENAGHFAPEENHASFNKTVDEFFNVKKSVN